MPFIWCYSPAGAFYSLDMRYFTPPNLPVGIMLKYNIAGVFQRNKFEIGALNEDLAHFVGFLAPFDIHQKPFQHWFCDSAIYH